MQTKLPPIQTISLSFIVLFSCQYLSAFDSPGTMMNPIAGTVNTPAEMNFSPPPALTLRRSSPTSQTHRNPDNVPQRQVNAAINQLPPRQMQVSVPTVNTAPAQTRPAAQFQQVRPNASLPTADLGYKIGNRAARFSGKLINDEGMFDIARFADTGRPTLLVFFGTRCAACNNELPDIKAFAEQQGNNGVGVVAVAKDAESSLKRYVTSRRQLINYPVIHDENSSVFNAFAIKAIPTVIGIGADGIIRFRNEGFPSNTSAMLSALWAPPAR